MENHVFEKNVVKFNGGFTSWSDWSRCSFTCGTGSHYRSRDCSNPAPSAGGDECIGDVVEAQTCLIIECPVDGGLTDWTVWGDCTQTCGTGSQTRSRDCSSPAPQYGGMECVGDLQEYRDCNTELCPINGGYTSWTIWGECSATCGTGSRSRSRGCTHPAPQYSGSNCVGEPTNSQDCNADLCPINGGFTSWSDWSSCSFTCGTGSHYRSRDCSNPAPFAGGDECIGDVVEAQTCLIIECPVDGGLTDWTVWGDCTQTCGTGSHTRSRDCSSPALQYGGMECVGDLQEHRDCNTELCPINGGYTSWTIWGECSATCGTGSQSRSRDCTHPAPLYGGSDCVGEPNNSQDCNTDLCTINGGFTSWSDWSSCSFTCGTGSHYRSRDCSNPAPFAGGDECIGDVVEAQTCLIIECPVDGGLTDWTVWGDCTHTCGTGNQIRSRDCSSPAPQYGGLDCVGDLQEHRDCNTELCPNNGGYTSWTIWGECSATCGTGSQSRSRECTNPAPQYGGSDCVGESTTSQDCNTDLCPINGGITEWTTWNVCSKSCDTGSRFRSRECTDPIPQHGGTDCTGELSEIEVCNINMCPVDGGFTSWSEWTACTETCGGGAQIRSRDCINPAPLYGGKDCIGITEESNICMTDPCPINGGLTEWTLWGECTHSCGGGTQDRTRDCTNPAPQYGGNDCPNDRQETRDCNTDLCPVDGGFTSWTDWTACTETCGGGSQVRSRDCTNPTPLYGGNYCIGLTEESNICNTDPCQIDGGLTEWTLWGECTQSCGGGTQDRTRDCTNPAPQYGGNDCPNDRQETQACETENCPVDGGFTTWTEWSACTDTCGGTGSHTRTRTCTNPPPAHGGEYCVGDDTMTQACNLQTCPVDGGLSSWSDWSDCPVTCGTGSYFRTRSCTNPAPAHGGLDCMGDVIEANNCNSFPCPVDGGLSEWSEWRECTVSCGTGSQTRSRDCSNPAPQHGGNVCNGPVEEIQACNTHSCPIHGDFSEWMQWQACTHTCDIGSRTRSRDCTNPAPLHGGTDCVGKIEETENCNTNLCPVDGGFTEWTTWSDCVCGTNIQKRSRDCTNPAPQYGGTECDGQLTETIECTLVPCPVNGGFTEWTIWGECTVTCGPGTQSRSRDCSNPAPLYDGTECTGSVTQDQDCILQHCPIDGSWSEWTTWSPCTTTCLGESRDRTRSCTEPQHGGQECIGPGTESAPCGDVDCDSLPVNGYLSEWTTWTTCSATCIGGARARIRTCTPPQNGGQPCSGDPFETEVCGTLECSKPVDTLWSDWSAWSTCTVTCGGGSRDRTRTCTPPVNAGQECTGDTSQNEVCNTIACPGEWSAWLTWSTCTVTCGGGSRDRTRTCASSENGGQECTGDASQNEVCSTIACPGEWSAWVTWSTCTVTCGGGSRDRTRTCASSENGGQECTGDASQNEVCSTIACPGEWSAWVTWSTCTVTCGGGSRERTRTCASSENGGQECIGDTSQNEVCNSTGCPGEWSAWLTWSTCTVTCGGGSRDRTRTCASSENGGQECIGDTSQNEVCNSTGCPGEWSAWLTWSTCTVTCGGGSRDRTRTCASSENGGQECTGDASQNEVCNSNGCPGEWSAWLTWSTCTVTCGGGSRDRTRTCASSENGVQECTGDASQNEECNSNSCPLPVDGVMSDWSLWTTCTVTCGGGSQTRSRGCTPPQHGGNDCVGETSESEVCATTACPVNGFWSDWSIWSVCTVSCGVGTRDRSRTCWPPYNGGDMCEGLPSQLEICSTNNCPEVDGNWGPWTDWTTCSKTCVAGYQTRLRTCSAPIPENGGRLCEGDHAEIRYCNEFFCPVDGRWSDWTDWVPCYNKTTTSCDTDCECGVGFTYKNRTCNNPLPQHGGHTCLGDDLELETCNVPCLSIQCDPNDPSQCEIFFTYKGSGCSHLDGHFGMNVLFTIITWLTVSRFLL